MAIYLLVLLLLTLNVKPLFCMHKGDCEAFQVIQDQSLSTAIHKHESIKRLMQKIYPKEYIVAKAKDAYISLMDQKILGAQIFLHESNIFISTIENVMYSENIINKVAELYSTTYTENEIEELEKVYESEVELNELPKDYETREKVTAIFNNVLHKSLKNLVERLIIQVVSSNAQD